MCENEEPGGAAGTGKPRITCDAYSWVMGESKEPEEGEAKAKEPRITYAMECIGASILMEGRDSCDAYSLARDIYIAMLAEAESAATPSTPADGRRPERRDDRW